MPLHDLKSYFSVHKHLPNFPSGQEIILNGWEVGMMNNKLLEKLEELTLYIIELDAKSRDQDQKIRVLEEQLKRVGKE